MHSLTRNYLLFLHLDPTLLMAESSPARPAQLSQTSCCAPEEPEAEVTELSAAHLTLQRPIRNFQSGSAVHVSCRMAECARTYIVWAVGPKGPVEVSLFRVMAGSCRQRIAGGGGGGGEYT